MEILGKIFGSVAKVKIMRLFLFHPGIPFDISDISARAQVRGPAARQEITGLERIGMIKKKSFTKTVERKRGKKKVTVKKAAKGWVLNSRFPYLHVLQSFLIYINPLSHDEIAARFKKAGRVKLIIIAGIFIQDWDSRVDILVVGDKLRRNVLESVLHGIEAEVGRELRYTAMETDDFQYRASICDKLIRDILDYPHEKVLDKLNID